MNYLCHSDIYLLTKQLSLWDAKGREQSETSYQEENAESPLDYLKHLRFIHISLTLSRPLSKKLIYHRRTILIFLKASNSPY